MAWFAHLCAALLLSLSTICGSVVSADEARAPIDPAAFKNREAIDALVARMSDDEVRTLLLNHLASAAAETAEESRAGFDTVQKLWQALLIPSTRAIDRLPDLAEKQSQAIMSFVDLQAQTGGIGMLSGKMALVLIFALLVERVARRLVVRGREPEAGDSQQSLRATLRFLSHRLLREMFGLIVFLLVVRSVGHAVLSPDQLVFAVPFVTFLVWTPRLAAAMSRFLLAPRRPEFRLVALADRQARMLHRYHVLLFLLVGFNFFIIRFNAVHGVPPEQMGLAFWLDTSVYLFIILTAWMARDGLRDMMRGTDPDRTRLDETIAYAFPGYVIMVSALMWALVSTLVGLGHTAAILRGAHYTTMFWLFAVPVLDTAIRGLVNHLVPAVPEDSGSPAEAYRRSKRIYIHIARVIVVGAVIVLIARAWGIDAVSIIEDRPGLSDNLFAFLLTLVVGDLAYQGVTLWVARLLARETPPSGPADDEAEMGGVAKSRLSTVLPLILIIARGTVLAVFGLLSVGNLGVDITPLLAGAGVIGLAVGFGAQKLVTDIVSGIFFLIDDAFRIGEYVDIGGTMGTVERISIRSMTLRHHRGAIHTIPFGEIATLTNFSRDWVIMKLQFTVDFDTDPNKVKKIFKQIGAQMLEDPVYRNDFLQPFKSQGVFDIDDVGLVVRGKFMAKPGKQFMLRKELYNRVKDAFAQNGIQFARREIRVAMPRPDRDGPGSNVEESAVAVAAAATQVTSI